MNMRVVIVATVAVLSFVATGVNAQPLPGADVDLDHVCLVTTAANVEATIAASNAVPDDVPVGRSLGVGTSTAFFGLQGPFRGLVLDVGIAGTDGDLTWHYHNGLGWEELRYGPHDGPVNLDADGLATLTFKRPHDWEPRVLPGDCGGPSLYYLKASNGAPYTVPPVLNQVAAIV